ncbi:UNVERIFIED_CONTAM: hypothetical protein K2H54_045236 [Gekko kuhli]
MSSEEEDLQSSKEPLVLVTTTPVTTPLVTTIPVTTIPVTTMPPVTTVPTMTLSLLVYLPLSLGLQGAEGEVRSRHQDELGGFEWSTSDMTTQESWLLTAALVWESLTSKVPFRFLPWSQGCWRQESRLLEVLLKGLLNAKFDGTPEKLAFFVVPVEKFVQMWDHLFPTEARQVDYIVAQLRGGTADWYVSLHHARGPKLQEVAAFMWALRAKYGPVGE